MTEFVHLGEPYGSEYWLKAVCGNQSPDRIVSAQLVDLVTCSMCIATDAYKEAIQEWLENAPRVQSVERARLRRGDYIVVSVAKRMSQAEYDSVRDHIKRTWYLPEDVRVIILDGGDQLSIMTEAPGPESWEGRYLSLRAAYDSNRDTLNARDAQIEELRKENMQMRDRLSERGYE